MHPRENHVPLEGYSRRTDLINPNSISKSATSIINNTVCVNGVSVGTAIQRACPDQLRFLPVGRKCTEGLLQREFLSEMAESLRNE